MYIVYYGHSHRHRITRDTWREAKWMFEREIGIWEAECEAGKGRYTDRPRLLGEEYTDEHDGLTDQERSEIE
jgi:hypothetical protein